MKVFMVFVLVLIGNVSLGFDVLGVVFVFVDGIKLGDEVEIKVVELFLLEMVGCFVYKFLGDVDSNIVIKCYYYFCE